MLSSMFQAADRPRPLTATQPRGGRPSAPGPVAIDRRTPGGADAGKQPFAGLTDRPLALSGRWASTADGNASEVGGPPALWWPHKATRMIYGRHSPTIFTPASTGSYFHCGRSCSAVQFADGPRTSPPTKKKKLVSFWRPIAHFPRQFLFQSPMTRATTTFWLTQPAAIVTLRLYSFTPVETLKMKEPRKMFGQMTSQQSVDRS
jgi:hypothetical protein